jgi:hypothetical protein
LGACRPEYQPEQASLAKWKRRTRVERLRNDHRQTPWQDQLSYEHRALLAQGGDLVAPVFLLIDPKQDDRFILAAQLDRFPTGPPTSAP